MNRDQTIIRTSVIGIGANVLLAGFKAAVGMISGSIAVILDAVNNLSDALSSVITILGTKLAGRKPDRKHPYGHGRVEYLSAMLISVIVLYAGVTSLVESVKKIISPELPDYSAVGLIVIAVAVAAKIVLGRYVEGVGKKVHSDSLIASGKDATMDAVISASTLVAAVIFLVFHVSLEAWLAAVISLYIIKTGIEIFRDTLSQILGERVESEISVGVKETVCTFPEVFGAYDLILHNYGPETWIGSVHIEVPETLNALELDRLQREIAQKVFQEHRVILAGISVYAQHEGEDEVSQMHEHIRQCVMAFDGVLQMHGFYADTEKKTIQFDIVLDFALKDRNARYTEIVDAVQALYPEYTVSVTLDLDLSD